MKPTKAIPETNQKLVKGNLDDAGPFVLRVCDNGEVTYFSEETPEMYVWMFDPEKAHKFLTLREAAIFRECWTSDRTARGKHPLRADIVKFMETAELNATLAANGTTGDLQ